MIKPLISQDSYSFYSQYSLEQTKIKIEEILSKIDKENYKPLEKTDGNDFAWVSRWISPFEYKIYIMAMEKKPDFVVIRVEGDSGDALSIRSIFYLEKISTENLKELNFKPITDKSYLLSQTFNLIHPVLGISYTGYQSPSLTKEQMISRSIWFTVFDLFIIWAGGKNWFRNKWDPQKYSGNIIGGMLFFRAISGYQLYNNVRGHNRYIKLGYEFPLNFY